MKKKIIKYIKLIMSMTLILGLIAPSYASLSASDGSAFVTKAEFDSALADFNARLTSFEAGINSKIDSQVTSYLDRNGIWSGKSLDDTDSSVSADGYFWCRTWEEIFNEPTAYYGYTETSDVKISVMGQYYECALGSWTLGQATKSGLLYLSLKWYGTGTNTDRWYISDHEGNSGSLRDYATFGTGWVDWVSSVFWGSKAGQSSPDALVHYKKVANVISVYTFGSVNAMSVTGLLYGTPEVVQMFMVKKGDVVTMTRLLYGGAQNGNGQLIRHYNYGETKTQRPRFKINTAMVY